MLNGDSFEPKMTCEFKTMIFASQLVYGSGAVILVCMSQEKRLICEAFPMVWVGWETYRRLLGVCGGSARNSVQKWTYVKGFWEELKNV